jgi:hypothetical protein
MHERRQTEVNTDQVDLGQRHNIVSGIGFRF